MEPYLIEGMVAIRALLEGRIGPKNPELALAIAAAMHNLHANPMALRVAKSALLDFRLSNPREAETLLPQTLAWLDQSAKPA
ncbi:hypothetical protein [uncultured Tateyamaria sp.]|uniref:hypothetical protein n=1 Tax=uncultured Tateyamaria sp. TaxID=455651 RepID=UPI00262347CA|nr:hypothetical protein [uncultured Tateyamaria sp.]